MFVASVAYFPTNSDVGRPSTVFHVHGGTSVFSVNNINRCFIGLGLEAPVFHQLPQP